MSRLSGRTWGGGWVTDHLGARLLGTSPAPASDLMPVQSLVGMAVRRNPRRAHLLVSMVLGKHVPADPRLVHGTGLLLGAKVRDLLGPAGLPEGTVVIGFAETATGLGHCVAAALGARSLHSTRRCAAGMASFLAFANFARFQHPSKHIEYDCNVAAWP